MVNATHPVTYTGIPTKRKRNLSEETALSIDYEMHHLRLKKDLTALRSPVSPKDSSPKDLVKEENTTTLAIDSRLISKTIEAQFSLEILLKHNELRLIDQELAKCQVALEQLRRCHLIPYPMSLATPESMLNVSNGTGPIVSNNKTVPQWAPPFGVTDGPYTRHYAKWLIPDPSFDGVPWQAKVESRPGEILTEGRATRHSFTESAGRTGKLGLRGKTSQKLHALSSGYPQAKDKAGPCILKRSDGQTVKLVCLDCDRGNFSSTQGFINHCRIAHQRDYKSHEEAAVACGQSVDVNEAGEIIGDLKCLAVSNGLVHPLIRNAPTGKEAIEACKALLSRLADSKAMLREGRLPGFTSIPKSASKTSDICSESFVPSSLTPHLSDFLNCRGFSGNLNDIVVEAKLPIDIEDSPLEDDSDDSVRLTFPGNQTHSSDFCSSNPQTRIPARVDGSFIALGRTQSTKGIDERILKKENIDKVCCSHASCGSGSVEFPDTPQIVSDLSQRESIDEHDVEIEMINIPSVTEICPDVVSSNNAPSLVSDDGEYDEDNIDSGRSEDEIDDSDVAEIDIEEDIVSRSAPGDGSNRRSTARRLRKEQKEKHVTFVSPIDDSKKGRIKSRR